MKIRITDGRSSFGFSIPNALALNGITARIACSAAGKSAPEIGSWLTPEAVGRIFKELDRLKKRQGSWVLVEVQKADGASVTISI